MAVAEPASLWNAHVKLAPSSSRRSRTSSVPEVVPNLTVAGTTVAPSSGAPLRYHVTFGAGFPPADSHVRRRCSDSRGSRDVASVEMTGAPGITIRTALYTIRIVIDYRLTESVIDYETPVETIEIHSVYRTPCR